MRQEPILIAGAGIGGLALALTLHQIGIACQVFDSVTQLRPLGVGINLQPNAVRELADLGIGEEELDKIGVPAREWALVCLNGRDIYSEPRGKFAGYRWHQYAVHRGRFQLLLYRHVLARLGPDAVELGQKVAGYRKRPDDRLKGIERMMQHLIRAPDHREDIFILSGRKPRRYERSLLQHRAVQTAQSPQPHHRQRAVHTVDIRVFNLQILAQYLQ